MKLTNCIKKLASLTFAAAIGTTTLSSLSTACRAEVDSEVVAFEYDEFGNKIAAYVRFFGAPADAGHGLLWIIEVENEANLGNYAPDVEQGTYVERGPNDVPLKIEVTRSNWENYTSISIAAPLGSPIDRFVHLPLIDARGNKVYYKILSREHSQGDRYVTSALDAQTGLTFVVPIDHHPFWAVNPDAPPEYFLFVHTDSALPGFEG
ncbi:MAG: hypothetical protein LBJ95_04955 [Oscillospiraceae bacterium]|jgi:hypothetical protein|nr:hypothetical protein [Oscillospiraceae bacterium]